MAKSKTEKMVKKIITNDAKRSMYSDAELVYMELQLNLMKLERKKRKLSRKQAKGFQTL